MTELDVQRASGVLDTLIGLPAYRETVSDDLERLKDNIEYKMWTRSTITWTFECEKSKPRVIALNLMLEADEIEKGVDRSNKAIKWIAIVMCIAVPFAN